jgi:hypothetical protein
MSSRRIFCGLVALLVASSAEGAARGRAPASPTRAQSPMRAAVNDSDRRIDINNLNMWVTNYGSFAYDILTGNAGLVYPKSTTKTAVYASGLWLGAQVGSEIRIALVDYSSEYGPGKMVGGTFDNPNRPQYRVWKVSRNTGSLMGDGRTLEDTSHVERAGTYPEDPLVHHSWSEYMAGAAPYGAPWRLHRFPYQDVTAPADTDSVSVPGPDVIGDQMLWCVYNDADVDLHNNNAGSTVPLGVEVQQTTFAFNRQGPLGNTIFVKLKFINAGGANLTNMYASLWSDPDLGGFTDDLVGVDTTLSLGYCYNATNNDQQYGSAPPAVGYDFFLGPVNGAGDTLGVVSFNKYINGTDPGSFAETFNYMQGLLPDGSILTDPTTGDPINFFHPGDPVTGRGWLDSNPADRRFLLNSGPFSMAPGDTQEVVGAIIVGQGRNRLSSVAALKFFDVFAQDAFDKNFDLPSPPPAPEVDVAVDHAKVTLSWDAASRLSYDEPGYTFEGYNVYQSLSASGPWTLIATYDEINQTRVIFDEVFDIETGQLIPEFPVAYGSDQGVRFNHVQTTDAIRGGPLRDGQEYYFAVTAYSYNPSGLPKVLENPQEFIRVIPQRGAGGTDIGTASATPVLHLLKDGNIPPATDVVSVEVVDPNLVTGHVYKVIFEPLVPPFSGTVGADTATVVYSWSLVDSTLGTVVLGGQINKRGDEDYRVVDGLLVKVSGKYFPQFQEAGYRNVNPDHRRPIDLVVADLGEHFGLNPNPAFPGSSITPDADPADLDSMTTVEIRYDGTQKAHRYLRLEKQSDGAAPPQGRLYPYTGFYDVPFTVWDAVNNVQLEAGFVERGLTTDAGAYSPDTSTVSTFNRTWGPDTQGAREYMFVFRRPYTGAPRDELRVDGNLWTGNLPVLYSLWAAGRSLPLCYGTGDDTCGEVFDAEDYFEFVWANPARPNDVYVFNTSALQRGNTALAAGNLDRIRMVPNPYYNRSRYELNQFSRVVRFINLPEACTIRIFNLGGDLVRTLQKTDNTSSVLSWDLQTENALPVASGVYICHIDAPGVGSTFKRLAIFMERERLNNF